MCNTLNGMAIQFFVAYLIIMPHRHNNIHTKFWNRAKKILHLVLYRSQNGPQILQAHFVENSKCETKNLTKSFKVNFNLAKNHDLCKLFILCKTFLKKQNILSIIGKMPSHHSRQSLTLKLAFSLSLTLSLSLSYSLFSFSHSETHGQLHIFQHL